jgi:hypothetical protein
MKIFLFLFLLFSAQSWGYSITMTEDSEIYGGYSTSTLNQLLVETSAVASGTTPTMSVYIPFYDEFLDIDYTGSNGGSNIEYSIFAIKDSSSATPTNTLPSYNGNKSNPSVIEHQFNIENPSNETIYLYAALVDINTPGSLHIISDAPDPADFNLLAISRNTSLKEQKVNLSVFALCVNAQTPCAGLEYDNDKNITQIIKENVKVYFFLSNQESISQSPSVTDYPDGIYFKYILSNSVSSTPPAIDSVAKGDERVKVTFSGRGINNLNDVIAIKYPDSATPTEQTYYRALLGGGIIASDDNGPQINGSLILKNLTNGERIQVAIAYVNKFNFATKISDAEEQTPEQIQTFLQEKECYLLSAGFQKDHYVLEYFRKFRDNFLLKNIWGRGFVKWYYRTAPYYAGIIYENNFLRVVVRSLGYMTYFSLRFLPFLLSFLLIFTFWKFAIIRE